MNYPSKSDHVKQILETKYKSANLDKVIKEAQHLSKSELKLLYRLLKRFEILFDGTVGKWHGAKADIKLKEGVTPYDAKPYPVPKAHEKTLKMEVA